MVKLLKSGVKISGINEVLSSWRKNSFSLSSNIKQKIFDAFKFIIFMKNSIYLCQYIYFRLSIFYL